MTIKLYDAVRQSLRANINMALARAALDDTPNISLHREAIQKDTLRDAMYMSIGVLARLDVLNNPVHDETQAQARELVKLITERMGVDAEERFGVPLKAKL